MIGFIKIRHSRSIVKTIAIAIVCLLPFNELAWAKQDAIASRDSLAVPSQLSQEDFKRRVAAEHSVLMHRAANKAIKRLIEADKRIFGERWEKDRTGTLNVRDAAVSGHIKSAIESFEKAMLVKVTDLFKRTGQFAHVGLSGRYEVDGTVRSYGMPVIYVDAFYYHKADQAALKHELDELVQWEELRSAIAKASGISRRDVDMRSWIKSHIKADDTKLLGTKYGGMNAQEIARRIHAFSYPLQQLYAMAAFGKDKPPALIADYDYIRDLYERYAEEEGRDVNIAAADEPNIPNVLRGALEPVTVDTPPEAIYEWFRFNNVPFGSEMTARWGDNVNADSLLRYLRFLEGKWNNSNKDVADGYFALILVNITISTLGIASESVKNAIGKLYLVARSGDAEEDSIVGRVREVLSESAPAGSTLPEEAIALMREIQSARPEFRQDTRLAAIIKGLEKLRSDKEASGVHIEQQDMTPAGSEDTGKDKPGASAYEAEYDAMTNEAVVARIREMTGAVKSGILLSKRSRIAETARRIFDYEEHVYAAISSRLKKAEPQYAFINNISDIYVEGMSDRQVSKFYDEYYPTYTLIAIISDIKIRLRKYKDALMLAEIGLKRIEKALPFIRGQDAQRSFRESAKALEKRQHFMLTAEKAHLGLGNVAEGRRLAFELKNAMRERMSGKPVREPEMCGEYLNILADISSSSSEIARWEDARSSIEEIISLSHPANLSFDNRRSLYEDFTAAGEVYLRGIKVFGDIDPVAAAKRCVGLAEKMVSNSPETETLKAWISFEEGNMDKMKEALDKIRDIKHARSNWLIMYFRLMRVLALHLYEIGREDEAQKVCAAAESMIDENDRRGIGMRNLLAGFSAVKRGYGAALEDMRANLADSKASNELVVTTLVNQAILQIGKALREGRAPALYDEAGEPNDYTATCLELFSHESCSSRAIFLETHMNPERIVKGFEEVLKMMLAQEDPRITLQAKFHILYYLEFMRDRDDSPAWTVEQSERLLAKVDASLEAERKHNGAGKKRAKAVDNGLADLRSRIIKFTEEAAKSFFAGERLDRARRLFAAGNYQTALAEVEAGLQALEADRGDTEASDTLAAYKESILAMGRAAAAYDAQRFRTARLHYEKAVENLEEAGAASSPDLIAKLARARHMTEAEEAYEAGDFGRALQIAAGAGDDAGAKFAERVRRVREAESDPAKRVEAMTRLAATYPSDPRVKAFLSTRRSEERQYRNQLATANEIMQEARRILSIADITEDDLLKVMSYLRRVRETAGYSSAFGNLVRDAAKISYSRCIYRVSLMIARFGLSAIPNESRKIRDELLIIARDAAAQKVSEKLRRQHEILDCHFQAENLRTQKRMNERGTLDYNYASLKKSDDGTTIEMSGLSYEHTGSQKAIADVRTAITRGESYVLITHSTQDGMVQFALKAVSVYPERAIFKLERNEASRSAMADVPEEPGILKKLKDPSLKERRDAVFECMAGLESSLAEGKTPSTGNHFVDMLLDVQPPHGNSVEDASTTFRDGRIAADPKQRKAVAASLDDRLPTVMIQGPPGTGKTSVIVEIIRQARARGKKALLVSQSNPAVDNVAKRLLALQAAGDSLVFARVGNNPDAVDPNVENSAAYRNKKEALEAMRAARSGCVVLGTMGGFFSDHDMRRMEYYSSFDIVIVEEAGRATLAETLVPILRTATSGKVVLVGDHNQLPPYGIDETQIEETVGELRKYMYKKDRLAAIFSPGNVREFKRSPFETLWERSKAFRDGVHKHFLNVNRRAHPLLARFVSKLFYDGKIEVDPEKSATPEDDTLRLIDYTEDEPLGERGEPYRPIYERQVGKSYSNLREVNILLDEFDRLMNQKKDGSYRYGIRDITLITPFAPQRALIAEALQAKAVINRLRAGGDAGETAITETERGRLAAALKKGASGAEAAVGTFAASNPVGEARRRLLDTITGALIFDVSLRHGGRSIMPEDIEALGLVEVETVDSVQGDENKVVVLSLVRSNTAGAIGFMGTDDGFQRINVAFSRAQEKFVLIGDFTNTLTNARYTPRNPDPRSWFQRARRISTGRAQKVFKEAVNFYKEYRAGMYGSDPGAAADERAAPARERQDKGSPAKLLETVRDRLMDKAMSKEGFAFKEIARSRRYHPSTIYREIRTLVSLGILERVNPGGVATIRFTAAVRALGVARAAALIDSVNAIECGIGKSARPLDRYEIPEAEDLAFVKELVRNIICIEGAGRLAETAGPSDEREARRYVVRYNEDKLRDYAMKLGVDAGRFRELFELYVRALRLKLGQAKAVDGPKPIGGKDQPLISVECYKGPAGAAPLGRGQVDIGSGAIESGSTLRIIDMANIAFAVSNIPFDANREDLDRYERYIEFVREAVRDMTGKDISVDDILKGERLITLPAIRPIPFDRLKEYYEFTIRQLAQAA